MTLNFFNRLLWAVVLIVLQAFIFNQVCLFGYATPIIYVYILCLQPLNTPRYAWLFWGFGVGTITYIASYRMIGKIVTAEYWPVVIWPAFLVCGIIALSCYINLKAKIKTVTKHSIVENIREL